MKRLFFVAWLGVALALARQGAGQDSEILTRVDEALKAVASFEMGGNSGPLQEIERVVFHLPSNSELRKPLEQKLLGTLESNATTDAKRFVCRQLRVIGTEKCVPALARLLTDPELAHVARYALGRLEFPAATDALLGTLEKTSGELQAGIIDTLGNRRCVAARRKLIQLLRSSDQNVARAAAISLGRLGDSDSAAALEAARPNAGARLQVDIDNALLEAAEKLAAEGKPADAVALYKGFYARTDSQQMQFAGLRGLVVTQTAQAASLLAEAMRADDRSLRRYAFSLAALVPGRKATEAFVGAIDSLPVDDRVLLLRALGSRGDEAASGAIIAATKDNDTSVRTAALDALGKVGDASVVSILAEAAATTDGLERNVARAALKSLSAAETNDRLLQLLKDADAKIKVELIRALANRGADNSVDTLLHMAAGSEADVRRASIDALGALAGERHLTKLLKVAVSYGPDDDREALIGAIGKAFARTKNKAKAAAVVQTELARAAEQARPLLVRLLGMSGAPEALRTIRGNLKASTPELREATVRALAEWPDASVRSDLLNLLTDRQFGEYKQVVLAGYLRLAAQADDPSAMYLQALEHVSEVNDKRAVLEGLGLSSETPQAIDVTLKYLDDSKLQAAAGVATLRIAYRLRQRDESRARSALKQVLAKVDHPDVQKRAQEVLNEVDKYQDHILQWVTVGPFQESGKDGAAIYRTVFSPETDPNGADWKPLTKGIGSWEVNLEATYGGLDSVGAYLRTRVWSDVEQDVQLEMGSDDGVKAWLNGKLLYDRWGEGGAAPRQKLVKAKLLKGWNDLMLKVVDQRGGWVGACRIRKPNGTAIEGLKYKAE